MTTIVGHNELVLRAASFVLDEHREHPDRSFDSLIEEASMRFNLGPLDSEALRRILCDEKAEEAH